MTTARIFALICAVSLTACTGQRLPTTAEINFYKESSSQLALCAVTGKNSIYKGNSAFVRAWGTAWAARRAAPEAGFDLPIIDAMQREAQSCEDNARKSVEPLYSKALESSRSDADTQRLKEYFALWTAVFAVQKPIQADLILVPPDRIREVGLDYEKRVSSAIEKTDVVWKSHVLAGMSWENFCAKELPKIFGQYSSEWHTAIVYSARFYDVDLNALKDKELGLGTRKCAAMAKWGVPAKAQSRTDVLGNHEVWTYSENRTLSFLSGVVISITN